MMDGKHMMDYPKAVGSRKFVGGKIKKLLKEGKKKDQAVAIALEMSRKHKA